MDEAKIDTTSKDEAGKLRADVLRSLLYDLGKSRVGARERDWSMAVAYAVRERIVDRWIDEARDHYANGAKQVYYLSMEFLTGRLLRDNVVNLGIEQPLREALAPLGVDFDRIREEEPDAALGNGGLGRLAACFMESMASLCIPAFGYGIRYDHGLFRQEIRNGWQREFPEEWLRFRNPWEFARPEIAHSIGFGGTVEATPVGEARIRHSWTPAETVEAVAYDTPVVGWRGRHVNTLRLWSARASDPLILDAFNRGDHLGALSDRMKAESISKILYPADDHPAGQELRLKQEYFFASAALQDLVRRHIRTHGDIRTLPHYAAIQLNDTHPAIAIAELMRIMVDQHDVPWDEAWEATRATFSYTNHTLLPEALESWPVPLLERLLPRHMQIIYLLNAVHLDHAAAAAPGDLGLLASVSLIDEAHGRRVRMGHLAYLGSHKVNGVSALHTRLLRQTVFGDMERLYPGRIVNKTNGITFRRWFLQCNPGLAALASEVAGPEVRDDATLLARLKPCAEDASFRQRFAAVKRANKAALAQHIRRTLDIAVDPDALFDVQVKRIHEYKRQLLNVLHTVALYDELRSAPSRARVPVVKIFAGKAAASYHRAKLIIKLMHDVARMVNSDPVVRDRLKVVFLPNYNVSLAELIMPAADLSEQISTAGMEASGTGNMKLALNGALTIGTLDGANVEILEQVGAEHLFIFGLTAEQVEKRRRAGIPGGEAIGASRRLAEALEQIESGVFSPDDRGRYRDLVAGLHGADHFMVAADFDAYWDAQCAAATRWTDRDAWLRSAVVNTASMAWFSSDRTIAEYASEIWNVPGVC
ncbi:MAG: glycogen/starch/alpha-glucan phosphorylase [Acetobacteraceae bacterium]